MRTIGIALTFLVGSTQLAHAYCAAPEVEFAPAAGDLPAQPTIYVFVPAWLAGGSFMSPDVGLAVVPMDATPAFHVFRVRILADTGEATVVYRPDPKSSFEESFHRSYRLGATTATHAARVVDMRHVASSWTCSHTNAIDLTLDGDAIALRLDWHSGEPSTTVPAQTARLGYSSCTGRTAYVEDVRAFDLVALFSDGTERRIGRSKLRIDDVAYRLPTELAPILFANPEVAPVDYPRYDSRRDADDDRDRSWGALACLVALLAFTRFAHLEAFVRVPR